MNACDGNPISEASLSVSRTVNSLELDGTEWDVVVVGAGTGGAAAAVQLAAQGQRVLLVEAKVFPRDKVCGGCLNQRAWQSLQKIIPRNSPSSMIAIIESAGAVPVDSLVLNCLGQQAHWPTPVMHAISRGCLDCLLVNAAVDSGAVFCSGASAKVIDDEAHQFRGIRLSNAAGTTSFVRAGFAIVADGLGRSSLSEFSNMACEITTGSRLGLGAIIEDHSQAYANRELTMAVGRAGYVGLTRVEGRRLNVAAAVDAGAMKAVGPQVVVESILRDCRLPFPESLSDVKWTGTLPLTRTSKAVAARRLFTIGDSCGYVEPFTGEGMSWAIEDALQLCQLLAASGDKDIDRLAAAWNDLWKRRLRSKQLVCRGLASLLRYPRLASVSLVLARSIPCIPQWLISRASGDCPTRTFAGVA